MPIGRPGFKESSSWWGAWGWPGWGRASIPMPDFPHYSWSSSADADGWCSHGWFLEVLEKELSNLLGCSWGTKAYPKLLFRLGSMLGYPKIAEISCHCTSERSSLQTSRCFALLLTKLVVFIYLFVRLCSNTRANIGPTWANIGST